MIKQNTMKIYTENNWLQSNIIERIHNPCVDFSVYLKPYQFEFHDFHSECNYTAKKIVNDFQNQKLFLGLSGGIDSEFVCKVLLRNRVSFTPIIVTFHGNEEESRYAFDFCNLSQIDPIVLHLTDKQLAEIIYFDIFKKFNGIGILAAATIAAGKYVQKQNGILILAEHVVGDGDELIANFDYHFSEYDFYIDNLPFFCYTPGLLYAMVDSVEEKYMNWMTFKSAIFECTSRPKIRAKYSENLSSVITAIYKKRKPARHRCMLGHRANFLSNLLYSN